MARSFLESFFLKLTQREIERERQRESERATEREERERKRQTDRERERDKKSHQCEHVPLKSCHNKRRCKNEEQSFKIYNILYNTKNIICIF
jgi:hypothetical protein